MRRHQRLTDSTSWQAPAAKVSVDYSCTSDGATAVRWLSVSFESLMLAEEL